MMKDIEIAQQVIPEPITAIAAKAGLTVDQIDQYGSTKAKLKLPLPVKKTQRNLILVTSINPTPAGEGKSTVTIG
ncbi:hypothetical protein TUA1478L_30400 [Lactiplantibacillus plantarum]